MVKSKPRLFIGSSTEGYHIAEMVRNELSPFLDCVIWKDVFTFGNSAFEDLLENLGLFDFGILIATCDDITTSRKVRKQAPRDNIIFEFGLFAGRLGRTRSFLVAEEGTKIPSDLSGITLPKFSSAKGKNFLGFRYDVQKSKENQQKAISKLCEKISHHIISRQNIFDFGFHPSTALAFGYYNNFIKPAVTNLLALGKLKNGISFTDLRLTIHIPDSLMSDMFDKVRNARSEKKWMQIEIEAGSHRPFDFYIEMEKSSEGTIHLSDIPITLNSLNEALKAYTGRRHIGASAIERLLMERELNVFKNVLDHLIEEASITRGKVKTELVDI